MITEKKNLHEWFMNPETGEICSLWSLDYTVEQALAAGLVEVEEPLSYKERELK